LHGQWTQADWSGLTRCTGTFCAVHYNAERRTVCLIADKFGLRPIYYWAGPGMVVFATALRAIEQLRSVPLAIDVRGVTETAVFGFPLGERTAYAGISTIDAGQVVELRARDIRKSHYWRWDHLEPIHKDLTEVASDAYRGFRSAIDRRQHGERTAVAFLSGGLDSRGIVAALVDRGTRVHTLNFAIEGTQDCVFAAEIARVLGTRHHQLGADVPEMYAFRGRAYNQELVARLFDADADLSPLHRVIWSGDGGSVGVGHVYINEAAVRAGRSGGVDAMVDAFMAHNHHVVHHRLLKRDVSRDIAEIPRQGIREELSRLQCEDKGRALHLFLMLNDQRRHLANFYENIDVDRLEFKLPFFDGDFLEPILRSPIEGFLRHEFYMKWLAHFPASTVSTPWQAYRGHVPCPLPAPKGLRYQWHRDLYPERVQSAFKDDLVRAIDGFLKSPQFPEAIISRRKLQIANLATRLGIRNYSYLLRMAAVYCRYSAGGGRARVG